MASQFLVRVLFLLCPSVSTGTELWTSCREWQKLNLLPTLAALPLTPESSLRLPHFLFLAAPIPFRWASHFTLLQTSLDSRSKKVRFSIIWAGSNRRCFDYRSQWIHASHWHHMCITYALMLHHVHRVHQYSSKASQIGRQRASPSINLRPKRYIFDWNAQWDLLAKPNSEEKFI